MVTVGDEKLSEAAQHLMHKWGAYELSFTWMGTKKALTKDQKKDMAERFDADPAWLSGSKKLLDTKDEAWKRVTDAKKAIKEYWESHTLPWPKDGVRLVRREGWSEVQSRMVDLRYALHDAVDSLDNELQRLIRAAERKMGTVFDRADYPNTVHGLFDVEWEPVNVDPPEYLASEHPELFAAQSARIAARFDEAARMAEEAFCGEFLRLAGDLTDKLAGINDGQPKRLHDANVENLAEFFQKFRRLNIHSSEELDKAIADAEQAMKSPGLFGGTVSRDELKDSAGLRAAVATKLSAAMASIEGMMVNQPRRAINRRQAEK